MGGFEERGKEALGGRAHLELMMLTATSWATSPL